LHRINLWAELAWWPASCWATFAVVGRIGLVARTVLGCVGPVARVGLVGALLGCAWSVGQPSQCGGEWDEALVGPTSETRF
jgi:hypothetical protein